MLPARASDEALLVEPTSGISLRIRLEGTLNVPFSPVQGDHVFASALGDGTALRTHVLADGFEDFVSLARAPEPAELRYRLELSPQVAGLRLVANQLEVLSADGAPRLRVPAPWLVDASGARQVAELSVLDCAFDAEPRAPWGRPVTAPGAAQCTVQVSWAARSYPMVVDPAWQGTGSLAYKRVHHVATTLKNGLVLITGGQEDDGVATELYDPKTGTFSATGVPKQAHYGHSSALLLDGRVLVAGGDQILHTANPTCELYDPQTGKWTTTGDLNEGRSWAAAVTLNDGRVLLAGGLRQGVSPSADSSVSELYDPALGTWTKTPPLAVARLRHTLTKLNDGRVLLVGGFGANVYPAEPELYDPAQNKWLAAAPLGLDVSLSSAVLLKDGRVLVAGCGDAGSLYDPTKNAWAKTGNLKISRCGGQTLALLANGDALLSGGQAASTERFKVATGEWLDVGNLSSTYRYYPTATPLPGGSVLLTGGGTMVDLSGGPYLPTESAETFSYLANGKACELDGACLSAFCVDGVCCDTDCSGLCHSCVAASKVSGADGTCGLAKVGTDPHESCSDSSASSCGTNGVCDGAGACQRYAVGTVCSVDTCMYTKRSTPGACSAAGQCVGSIVTECNAGYQCVAGACASSCSDNAACSAGYLCQAGSCAKIPADGQAGASNSSGGAAGGLNAIAGNTSNPGSTSGAGGGGAASSGQPGNPAAGSASGPTSSNNGNSSGCSCSSAPSRSRGPFTLGLLFALGYAWQRRRRLRN